MATKTQADYKAQHTTGYTCQKLGFDNRRPFGMGLKSQQKAESPFKVKFEPHMMYKDGEEVMAKTYEKHLELKKKGYGHTKPKSPAKLFKKRKAKSPVKDKGEKGKGVGTGYMNPPYKDTVKAQKAGAPYAKRQGYHGFKDFDSNVKPEASGNEKTKKKSMKDGPKTKTHGVKGGVGNWTAHQFR